MPFDEILYLYYEQSRPSASGPLNNSTPITIYAYAPEERANFTQVNLQSSKQSNMSAKRDEAVYSYSQR